METGRVQLSETGSGSAVFADSLGFGRRIWYGCDSGGYNTKSCVSRCGEYERWGSGES
jgi:hypothetical protein